MKSFYVVSILKTSQGATQYMLATDTEFVTDARAFRAMTSIAIENGIEDMDAVLSKMGVIQTENGLTTLQVEKQLAEINAAELAKVAKTPCNCPGCVNVRAREKMTEKPAIRSKPSL